MEANDNLLIFARKGSLKDESQRWSREVPEAANEEAPVGQDSRHTENAAKKMKT